MLATLIPAGLTWTVFLLRCGKPMKERLQLLRRLSIAILLLAVALGSDEWLVTTRLAPNLGWPEYVTVVPPLIGDVLLRRAGGLRRPLQPGAGR